MSLHNNYYGGSNYVTNVSDAFDVAHTIDVMPMHIQFKMCVTN